MGRQVRQRMNRLGKPEHPARLCFFSKKKSLAGMRRFPIPSEIQIRMGFNRSATSLAALKLFLISPTRGRCFHHHARRNYRRTAARHPRPPAGTKRHSCPWNFALLCAQSRVLGFRASGFAGCSRFLGFASRLCSRAAKTAKQEPLRGPSVLSHLPSKTESACPLTTLEKASGLASPGICRRVGYGRNKIRLT